MRTPLPSAGCAAADMPFSLCSSVDIASTFGRPAPSPRCLLFTTSVEEEARRAPHILTLPSPAGRRCAQP